MLSRLPFPVRPFDTAPPQVVEAAKRLFTLRRGRDLAGRPTAPEALPIHSALSNSLLVRTS